ncbi:MAG: hypothetical protein MR952_06765 [Flavonifractor plautii]|nr:hypothetical protein [Flavonifractor plautii]
MKKHIFAILLSCAAITSAYFCLDINNTIAGIGIPTQEINWDIASIVISNLVVIGLYLITFNLLDSRQIKMSKNQREVALLLLFKTYEQCKGSVSLFELCEVREKAVEKCDFDKVIHEDKQMQYYLDFPFEFHEQIIEFASTGTISKKEFSDYLELREAFRKHINIRIMSFDREELPNATKRDFLETYERVTNFLNRGENSARF